MEKLKRYIVFLIGCLILGFGVYTEVLANVAMLPGESFVRPFHPHGRLNSVRPKSLLMYH